MRQCAVFGLYLPASPHVRRLGPIPAAWWNGAADDDLWRSSLVLGGIRKGVELARRRDRRRVEALEAWLDDVMSGFSNRTDLRARTRGRMNAIRPIPVIDALLAEQPEQPRLAA